MNQELEKLVDYALVDGYITDKEKQVLFKKAQSQGFDTDELDMILEGKLFEINKAGKPAVNKCPNCGEIMSGLSKVCPSCDYVINSQTVSDNESVNDSIRRLEESVYALRAMPQPGVSPIIASVILIIFTSGLYIIYKKLIKKEALFDRFAVVNQKIVAVTDMQVRSLQTKYGDDEKISKYVNDLVTERNDIIRKRQKADAVSAIATFVIVGVVLYLSTLVGSLPTGKTKTATEVEQESAESITRRHINAGNIGAAKLSVEKMENGIEKNDFLINIRDMEIDSLTTAGNYDAALGLARLIKSTDAVNDVNKTINSIVEKQVDDLVIKKEYSVARERASLLGHPKSDYLLTSIKVAESLDKSAQKDIKTSGRASKKRKR